MYVVKLLILFIALWPSVRISSPLKISPSSFPILIQSFLPVITLISSTQDDSPIEGYLGGGSSVSYGSQNSNSNIYLQKES